MAKKPVTDGKSFEESLWDSATKLRGSVASPEYKHIVLSLIFLKFVSDMFEERRSELIAEGQGDYVDMVEFYTMRNVFYLPETSRWSHIQQHAKQGDIAIKIDTALKAVENSNASLKGALPDNYFSRLGLDASKLSALIDVINNIDTVADKEEDVVGRVYEYFLGKFASSEGKLGGEFYTPKCVVNLIAEMIEPYKGKIYDPCCGSGGMFVQSLKFVKSHHGNTKDISVYGQEYTATTYKLAKMNLAVRGLSANLGDVPADTFFKDQHPDLKADYIMANPPFNLKDWRGPDELVHDPRWSGYETPPTGNANYAWILHMISKLSENGIAGFVLANGSMSTNTTGEGQIRQKMVENDLVDCMIALPGQLFYTVQIPVCLWFLTKNKSGGQSPSPSIPLPEVEGRQSSTNGRGGFYFSGLVETARELRKKQTPAEDIVWELLRNKKFMGLKFRRQHQIGDYIVDFYCHEHKLVIELDGSVHSTPNRKASDKKRDSYLKSIGNTVLRFENKDVTDTPDVFLSTLESNIHGQAPLPLGETNKLRDLNDRAPLPLGEAGVRVNSLRDRRGEVLFIDARKIGSMISRTHKELTVEDISKIAKTYHSWRGEAKDGVYEDEAGYCKSATLDDMRKHDYVLTPGRYVGAADIEDDGIPFETKMTEMSQTLYAQMEESKKLDEVIRKNLEGLGYGEC
ncbi:MAG: N-6 DNA methylase [Kiritimatiellae bacterium]|jgi:type I restriction enzyme M protein|nr:N-6 DNA methylase [Kiritimatiellia bacterium]